MIAWITGLPSDHRVQGDFGREHEPSRRSPGPSISASPGGVLVVACMA